MKTADSIERGTSLPYHKDNGALRRGTWFVAFLAAIVATVLWLRFERTGVERAKPSSEIGNTVTGATSDERKRDSSDRIEDIERDLNAIDLDTLGR